MFVRRISSEPQNILMPNLVWLCSIISQSIMQKNWFIVFNVKVTARAYIIKIWLFLFYLLNYCSVCNQTWFDSTALEAGVSCGKMGLLRSRSRPQRRFKMLVNVCSDDIFWTTKRFVTKPGMDVQHHKPEWLAEKLVHCVNVKVTARAYIIKIWLFLLYLLNSWSVCNQTWFDTTES